MKRLSLATQVALIVGLAIFLVQSINLALAIQNRRAALLNNAVAPAAQRLAIAAVNPDEFDRPLRIEPRSERQGRQLARADEPRARMKLLHRPTVTPGEPIPADARRSVEAEKMMADIFKSYGVSARDYRAAALDHPPQRRTMLVLAAKLDDGRWISVRTPGPQMLRPLVGLLIIQSFFIMLAILLPTLWLLRRVGRSLRLVTRAASEFGGAVPTDPIKPTGPRDVRALIDAVNAMQSRIAAMLSEKDVMLGAIGHDLRTPLTALRLEAEAVEDEERRAALVAQVEALHEQFEQVLEFARAGRSGNHREPLGLEGVIRDIAGSYDGRVRSGRIDAASVSANPPSLRRAITNIVDNALRYAGDATLVVETVGEQVAIRVIDSGPGIPDDKKESAIAPFGRLEESRNRASGGHGLGLSIVAAVARAHGGQLLLEDKSGGGLIASILLPRLP